MSSQTYGKRPVEQPCCAMIGDKGTKIRSEYTEAHKDGEKGSKGKLGRIAVKDDDTHLRLPPGASRRLRPKLVCADSTRAPPAYTASEPGNDMRYCVSYAWGDGSDAGREREAYVDELCADASRRGFKILRDKTVLGLGERVTEFMCKLASGLRVFVILSDKYLRSPSCTFELYEVWRNCRLDDREFLRRVRVFVLPEVSIWTLAGRKAYHDFWEAQVAEQDALIHGLSAKGHLSRLSEIDFKHYRQMKAFSNHVLDILSAVADALQPRTWDDFVRYGFIDPPELA